ncbi:acyl carrier protein [Buchnera aphidicola (Formosaphis micheliae)]|uniref:acyl carrier protein n=1 Tax=Buchnera aphidicola TaxID=9 RepID=UPI0031B84B26
MNNIDQRIKKILSEQLGIQELNINKNHSITDDLGADSLDFIELVMKLEKEFNIEIPDKETENLTTVQKIIHFIKNNTDEKIK